MIGINSEPEEVKITDPWRRKKEEEENVRM
jgi:hypothetical protein